MTVDAVDYKALPKIELHAHLSGSISRQCLHEVWLKKKENGETDLQDPLIKMPLGKHDYDLKTFFPLFSSYIYHLVSDIWALRHTTLSVLSDFAADGVVYLELRTTPRAMPQAGLTKAQYVATILSAITEFESDPNNTSQLKTKLILSIDRRNTLPEAYEVLALCRQFAGQGGVVGIDLCGDPARGPIDIFGPVFEEAKRTLPNLGITLHFAEAEASGTEEELLTLLSWRPDRIGHVIHLNEKIREEVKRRGGMGLELCLSCNVHAGMICGGFESHHFGEWWKVEETVVVLSTDDVGVFGSPLSNEYALVAKHFGLTRTDICSLVRRGVDVIFGGDEEKERLRGLMWSA
ncbi:hypothetical protein B0H65DRAFT_274076 [Neurospora tetraspora]|uniref:Adenosine deaminase domain-containing protein n=1 Tax=Neurospora tetraspora TaxID=94610 RepID=A0AAE0JBY3_9PEZI|nr:hypothetical protein B0H65DRAFT_274076 [Neurospora tetraspora]